MREHDTTEDTNSFFLLLQNNVDNKLSRRRIKKQYNTAQKIRRDSSANGTFFYT